MKIGVLSLCSVLAAAVLPAMEVKVESGTGCTPGDRIVDLSVHRDGDPETVRGPRVLCLQPINRLHHEIDVGVTVKLTDGPDLSLAGFIPTLPGASTAKPAAAAPPAPPPPPPPTTGPSPHAAAARANPDVAQIEASLGEVESALDSLAVDVVAESAKATDAANRLNRRTELLTALVQGSDQVLASPDGIDKLASQVAAAKRELEGDLAVSWPPGDRYAELQGGIAAQSRKLDAMKRNPQWGAWYGSAEHYLRYGNAQSKVQELTTALQPLAPDSKQRQAFDSVKLALEKWRPVLEQGSEARFYRQEVAVDCGYPFLQTKTEAIKLARKDRTAPPDKKTAIEEKLVTVECPSAVSISGGIGISGLAQREIKFVPGPPATAGGKASNRFGFGDKSSTQVNPAILINTRIVTGSTWALHLSGGTIFDINNSSSKTGIGYLAGLSASFRDNLFLTGGVQVGRVNRLAGGFNINDPVPDGLSEAPIERRWQSSWGIVVSYKIR